VSWRLSSYRPVAEATGNNNHYVGKIFLAFNESNILTTQGSANFTKPTNATQFN
jgi:hypothetical protein